MKKVVVFLQNAWSPLYAGSLVSPKAVKGTWPRESWLRALHKSRSGQRLKNLIDHCEGIEWWFDNTTPFVGGTPDSVIRPNYQHMLSVMAEQQPALVVCMGNQARDTWKHLARGAAYSHYPVLFLPHPAYRLLTSKLLREAAWLIEDGWEGERELRQEKPE